MVLRTQVLSKKYATSYNSYKKISLEFEFINLERSYGVCRFLSNNTTYGTTNDTTNGTFCP